MKKSKGIDLADYSDIRSALVKTAAGKIISLQKEKWIFQGWISTENRFRLTFSDEDSLEDYRIEGKFELTEVFLVTYAEIAFSLVDSIQDTYLDFKIEIKDRISLSKIGGAIAELLKQNKSYKYFLEDYKRYMSDSPVGYLKQLIENRLVDFNEMEDYGEELKYRYCGEYGEDLIEIGIDNNTDVDEFGDDPYDYLSVNVADRFHYDWRGYEDEEIRSLFNMLSPTVIPVEDFLVINSSRYCISREHQLKQIKALVCIMTGTTMKEVEADTLRCQTCDAYYITENEFRRLKSIGHICCHVVTIEEYKRFLQHRGNLSTQSLLRSYGYTTNAKDALSDRQRQRILAFVVENEIMTIYQTIDFLEWVVRRHSHKNMALARTKWNRDIEYLRNYKPVDGTVRVGKLFRKAYIHTLT